MSPRRKTGEERVADAIQAADLTDLGRERKTANLVFRLTNSEKEEVQATAKALGLSVADYILSLHRSAKPHLKR